MALALLNKTSLISNSDLILEDTETRIASLNPFSSGEKALTPSLYFEKKRLATRPHRLAVDNLVVHEEIKRGGAQANTHIENYKATLHNLGKCGVKAVGYNFVPLFYKLRTHFVPGQPADKYASSLFDPIALATFDLYILKRQGAEKNYNSFQRHAASIFNRRLSEQEKYQLCCNIFSCLQTSGIRTLNGLKRALEAYRFLNDEALQHHLQAFHNEIAPVAKLAGIQLVWQSDESSEGVLGLPCARMVL